MMDKTLLSQSPVSTNMSRGLGTHTHTMPLNKPTIQRPLTSVEVVDLTREAMKNALEEDQKEATEASGGGNELRHGVTVDLSHKNFLNFPDEAVDIIKTEISRYKPP